MPETIKEISDKLLCSMAEDTDRAISSANLIGKEVLKRLEASGLIEHPKVDNESDKKSFIITKAGIVAAYGIAYRKAFKNVKEI